MTRRTLALVLITLLAGAAAFAAVDSPVPSPPLLSLNYQLAGDSEEALVQEASARAAQAAVGRIYFSDYSLRARNLLEPYVDKNFERFTVHNLRESTVRGGQRHIDVDVVVDCEKLYDDLENKRFLYRPALRPLWTVFLSESFDGRTPERAGRERLLEMIHERRYRYLWQDEIEDFSIPPARKTEVLMEDGLSYANPMASDDALEAAVRAAERNAVEVFIGGKIETRTVREEQVYFDDYTFVEADVLLSLVRADTQEVLATRELTMTAGHTDPAEAAAAASRAAVTKLAPELFDVFDAQWNAAVLRGADARVMVLNANEESLSLFKQILAGLGNGMQMFTRSFYGGVAVLNLRWDGEADELRRKLLGLKHPDLVVAPFESGLIVRIVD